MLSRVFQFPSRRSLSRFTPTVFAAIVSPLVSPRLFEGNVRESKRFVSRSLCYSTVSERTSNSSLPVPSLGRTKNFPFEFFLSPTFPSSSRGTGKLTDRRWLSSRDPEIRFPATSVSAAPNCALLIDPFTITDVESIEVNRSSDVLATMKILSARSVYHGDARSSACNSSGEGLSMKVKTNDGQVRHFREYSGILTQKSDTAWHRRLILITS